MRKLIIPLILISIVLISGCIIDCDGYAEDLRDDVDAINAACITDNDCAKYDFGFVGCSKCYNKNENIDDLISRKEKYYSDIRCGVAGTCPYVECKCIDNVCTEIQ